MPTGGGSGRRDGWLRAQVDPKSLPTSQRDLALQSALNSGRYNWRYTGSEKDWGNLERHSYALEPSGAPASIEFTKEYGADSGVTNPETNTWYYDPAVATPQPPAEPGEMRLSPDFAINEDSGWKDEFSFSDDVKAQPGTIYRGLSHEEMESIRATGQVQSRGDYNIAGEKGTLWSTEPDQARSYATGFAPWGNRPGFDHPSYVIATKMPDDAHQNQSMTEEIVVPGAVKASDITAAYEFRPYAASEGRIELGSEDFGKTYGRMGSSGDNARYAYRLARV